MIDKTLLKQILLDNRKEIEGYKIVHRDIVTEGFNCYVFVGVRRFCAIRKNAAITS